MNYWIMQNGVQRGPLNDAEIRQAGITPDTPVWCEGFPDWTTASKVASLADLFARPQQPQYGPAQYQPQPVEACPPNYLAWAIVVTILCCWPFGIPAIVNAAGVNNAWQSGNYELARQKSANAKKWTIVSAIVGAVSLIILVIIEIVAITAASSVDYYY